MEQVGQYRNDWRAIYAQNKQCKPRRQQNSNLSEAEKSVGPATISPVNLKLRPSNAPRTQSQVLSKQSKKTDLAVIKQHALPRRGFEGEGVRGWGGLRSESRRREHQAAATLIHSLKEQAPSVNGDGESSQRPRIITPSKPQPNLKTTPLAPNLSLSGDAPSDKMTVHPTHPVHRYGDIIPPTGPAIQRRTPVQRSLVQISGPPSSHGRPANTFLRPSPQERGRTVIKGDEDWQTWVEVAVKVFGLPSDITTLDIHRLFIKEGSIESIEIFENSRGVRDGNARIRFR